MTSLVDTLYSKHKVSTANADASSAVVKRGGNRVGATCPMTSLVDTLDSKHKVSTANADTSSAVVKLAEEIDESAAHVR